MVAAGLQHASVLDVGFRDPADFVPGNLANNRNVWEELMDAHPDKDEILSYVDEVSIMDFVQPFEGYYRNKYYKSATGVPPRYREDSAAAVLLHEQAVTEDIAEEVRWGAVRMLGPDEPDPILLMPLVHVTQPRRTCLDARFLNLFMQDVPFRMETLGIVPHLFPERRKGEDIAIMWTSDHKRGYYHVKIKKQDQTFFGFMWKGQRYVYQTMPFGWSPAPYVYSKLSGAVWWYLRQLHTAECLLRQPVARHALRSQGVPGIFYLDDSMGRGRYHAKCSAACAAADSAFLFVVVSQNLGFYISLLKSSFLPESTKRLLGLNVDTAGRRFLVPRDKLAQFVALTREILAATVVPVKMLETWRGKASSFRLAIPAAGTFLRDVDAELVRAERFSGGARTNVIREELEEWLSLEHWNGTAPWRTAQHSQLTLFTDASLDGYGAVLAPDAKEPQQVLSEPVGDDPVFRQLQPWVEGDIAWLEARALEKSILHFDHRLTDRYLDCGIDNLRLCYALQAWQGSRAITQSGNLLNQRIKRVFRLCVHLRITLNVFYVPTKENPADAPSRDKVLWEQRECERYLAQNARVVSVRNPFLEDSCVLDRNDHMLNPNLFTMIYEAPGFGHPLPGTRKDKFRGYTVDAMASWKNVQWHPHKQEDGELLYYSRYYETHARCAGTNILAQDFSTFDPLRLNIYCNGPFGMTALLLNFFRQQKVRVTMILPEQPTAYWWPIAMGLQQQSWVIARKGARNVFLQPSMDYKQSVGPCPFNVLAVVYDFRV